MNQSERKQENNSSKDEIKPVSPTAPIDIQFPSNATKGEFIHKKQKVDDNIPYMKENYSLFLSHSTPTDAMKHSNFERNIVENAPPFHLFDNKNDRQFLIPLWPRKSRRRTFSGSDISLTDSDIFSIIEGADSEFNKENVDSKDNSSFDHSLDLCPPNLKMSKMYSYSHSHDSAGEKSFLQFINEDGRCSFSAPDERVWQGRKNYSSNPDHKYIHSRLTMDNEDIPKKYNEDPNLTLSKEDILNKYFEDTSTELVSSLSKNHKDYGECRSRSTSENSQTDESESSDDDSYWLWANYMYSEGLWHS